MFSFKISINNCQCLWLAPALCSHIFNKVKVEVEHVPDQSMYKLFLFILSKVVSFFVMKRVLQLRYINV